MTGRQEHYQQLQRALSLGDVPRLQKYFAIVQNDPAFAGSELVTTALALRQVLHSRKVMKMGLECLKATPWEYPAEQAPRKLQGVQVDFNVSVLRNSQLGPGIWDDPLLEDEDNHLRILANAKALKDADVLKLLRSVRPYNENGSLKTRFDMDRCTKAWLAQTEASLIGEDASIKILLRLCECRGDVAMPLALALNEPFLVWRFASEARAAFQLEEVWKLLWTNGQINKAMPVMRFPCKVGCKVMVQTPGPVPVQHLRLPAGSSAEVRVAVHPRSFHVRFGSIAASSEVCPCARLVALLYTIPGHTLFQLSRQGLLAIAAKSVVKTLYGRSALAALLQSCAATFGLQSLVSEAKDEGSPVLALCLKAAAAVTPRQFRYSRQEQSEMRSLISECASIVESLEPGQLVVEGAS
eukprot:Skav202219  [mRNA]  locus=scaffold1756:75601:83586:- [translate_table: standard]